MEPEPPTELEAEIDLLRRIGLGDKRAFSDLYDRFSGLLFSTAYRVLNQQEAAEDVLQDVFIQIWEKAPLYDPARGKPLTWAVTLTRNKSIDRLRSTQRRARLQDDVEKEASTVLQFDDSDAFEGVASMEQGAMVREALSRLGAEQREVLEMAFFKGLTQTEIAEQLGKPLGTVKARIRRGMMRLRELVEPHL